MAVMERQRMEGTDPCGLKQLEGLLRGGREGGAALGVEARLCQQCLHLPNLSEHITFLCLFFLLGVTKL